MDEARAAGAWVKSQRLASGMTQEELAGKSGLSVRAISNLERGRDRRPHPRADRRGRRGRAPVDRHRVRPWPHAEPSPGQRLRPQHRERRLTASCSAKSAVSSRYS
jgi:Helix-turn-helix